MQVVTGRFAEARLYLIYCAALLHPGRTLPTFGHPQPYTGNLDSHSDEELGLLVEEGRRQFDRQMADLDRIRNRAGALATVSLALAAAVVTRSSAVLERHAVLVVLWVAAAALAALSVAGAASVLSAQAVFGRTDTRMSAEGPRPTHKHLAEAYVEQVSIGEETVRTFLTVFRDAVTLAVLSALAFLLVLAGTLHSPDSKTPADRTERTCPTSTICSVPSPR